ANLGFPRMPRQENRDELFIECTPVVAQVWAQVLRNLKVGTDVVTCAGSGRINALAAQHHPVIVFHCFSLPTLNCASTSPGTQIPPSPGGTAASGAAKASRLWSNRYATG